MSFPSNTNKPNSEKSSVVDKVTNVVSEATKYNGKPLGEYIVDDIIVPNAKRLAYDGVSQILRTLMNVGLQTVSNILFNTNVPPAGVQQNTNYSGYSSPRAVVGSSAPIVTSSVTTHSVTNADNAVKQLIFPSPVDATDILNQLIDMAAVYGSVRVSTLYELAGKTIPNLLMNNWGWRREDLDPSAFICSIEPVPGGYTLNMPKCVRF